jgi:hypothetical protein
MHKLLALIALLLPFTSQAAVLPDCRLDHTYNNVVASTAQRALTAFKSNGKDTGLDQAVANPASASATPRTLSVYVVKDAAADGVDGNGCVTRKVAKGDTLDQLSVRGGCFVKSADRSTILCSSEAVRLFAYAGENADRNNPALLYVLAHEIGHVYQKRAGEYAGSVITIQLASTPAEKLSQLRARCEPTMTEKEQAADDYALEVLRLALPKAPYRETVFSEQGSLFWNIDLLALAANKWALASTEREFMSPVPVHKAFEPTEFPTPPAKIALAARKLVCDVAKRKTGTVSVPAVSATHPPAEQRLRNIAEVLKPVARALPRNGGSQAYQPVAVLQQDLGPIFTHIYRETGVYLEALETQVCTLVNAPDPLKACK